ncbi:MAG: putative metal-binding motif-containing protein [Myxococcota bacterium]|nr:putative metal-binding motif-containing protein [Myxococcota bacterium]
MILWLLSCQNVEDAEKNLETVTVDTVDDTSTTSASPSDDSFPDDIDDDGYGEDEDCDNWDPEVHPGAEEVFDHIDNNCDGIVDFDGEFSGIGQLWANAIYEGVPYPFEQQCQLSVIRNRGLMTLDVLCDVDLTQTNASLLLGEEILLTAQTNTLHEQVWSDRVPIRSQGGDMEWDTQADASLSWSALSTDFGSQIQFDLVLESFSLNLAISGVLSRQ